MKIYLNIPDEIQELLDEQSINLKTLVNDNVDDITIEEIRTVENPLGAEGGKSLISLLIITGVVINGVAGIIKGLKTLYDTIGLIEKKFLLKRKKEENGYEKIIKEALEDSYKVQETDEVYVEIIKKALE